MQNAANKISSQALFCLRLLLLLLLLTVNYRTQYTQNSLSKNRSAFAFRQ